MAEQNIPQMSQLSVCSQQIGSIFSSNLKRLLEQRQITQKQLAEDLGVAPGSMSEYCSGKRIPGAAFLVALKNRYGISIDDFLTKSINHTPPPVRESPLNQPQLSTCLKYCGTYFLYYFDGSKYKGRDTQSAEEALLYGVLLIYDNPSSLNEPEFNCAAVLGIRNREEARALKRTFDELSEPATVLSYIDENHPHSAYYGDFELSQEHAFISLSNSGIDKALLILHRVDSNKENYLGGIGTINSVCKGRHRLPVVQFIGVSRYPLNISEEEIQYRLLLNYPTFKADTETEDLIRLFRTLYVDPDTDRTFSDYQKIVLVRTTLEDKIKKSLKRNVFRCGKVTEQDDDDWYHGIKHSTDFDN